MKAADPNDPHDQCDPKDPSAAALGDTTRQPALYVQLAEKLARAIRAGTLARGERMLSVRELARQQQVSQSTVVQAYRWLEDALLIQARPRSGYFVAQRPKSLPEPQTSRPSRLSRKVHLDDLGQQVLRLSVSPDIISFGAAAPEPELFDQERVRRALIRTVQRHRDLLCTYQLGSGQEAVRRAVARHALGMGCELEADDIIMTNSCLESITLCLQAVTKPGDVVALESPTYFGFLEILQSLHLRALEIPTHPRHGVSLDALQLALETQPVKAVLLVPTLSNPLGCSMSLADRRRLAQLVQARNVALIEDAVYNDLAEQEDKRRAVKSFDRSGQVMLCGSFSKTLVPGLRLGWVAAGRWTPGLRKIQTVQSGVQTAVLELTLAELLGQSGNEAALRQLRATLAQRVDLARRLIAESFPKGSRITDPGGGFILWVELPAGIDALHLYEACLAENICIAPGQLFSAGPRFKHCLRLSVGGRWGPAHPQALRRIGELARELLERGKLSLAA
ncbi:PLP-dependent aminotransferase family protein [Paucibacter sp. DJ2R-2]|uniref:aminotransferase-like domain-containing protein n=1 Tax=Paucibacter sp. DJ2R-2 TaxID=2893558 RepID=UPI0021E4D192|nr:PLP-dependent aminotransferase family protein [Paucibacter sp. DJ2R-2]MCV2421653.1 PLP-dependent aminotransferase family protein [Paucibacter sp. DJ4R-1]MCV2438358.1 PLP-dependent aminotransferase family protein [Paucibacter sp. DJ2R-2]